MINIAGLKGHTMAGMTATAKNHLGSLLTGTGSSGASRMHASIAVKSGGDWARSRLGKGWVPTTAWWI
jgi:hypothetical protein